MNYEDLLLKRINDWKLEDNFTLVKNYEIFQRQVLIKSTVVEMIYKYHCYLHHAHSHEVCKAISKRFYYYGLYKLAGYVLSLCEHCIKSKNGKVYEEINPVDINEVNFRSKYFLNSF